MTSPKKFKGNQAVFNVSFIGLDVTLPGVMVKEVDIGEGSHWATLEERNGRWLMLTTPGFLVEPSGNRDQAIHFDRSEPDAPNLITAYCDTWPIGVHTQLHIGDIKRFYSIDQSPKGLRIQYTDNLIPADQHALIKCIKFERVAK